MSDLQDKAAELIRRQQELLDPTGEVRCPPAHIPPARFHAVVTGQDRWRADEETLIAGNPVLLRYAAMWQEAVATSVNREGAGGANLESDEDAKILILRFEPAAAPLFDLDGFRLLPEAAGDERLPDDLAAAEDIYCAKLGPIGTFQIGFCCLPKDQSDLRVIDLSSGEDTVSTGAVRFDGAVGRLVVDAARLPLNEWRLYYVGPENYLGSKADSRAVFALIRGEEQDGAPSSPCQLILQGRLIDALVGTAQEKPEQRRLICRRWLVVARMELLLKRDALPAIEKTLRNPSYEFLLSELREIADRRLDLVKQSLTEMFPR
jgi:hypothetical protein